MVSNSTLAIVGVDEDDQIIALERERRKKKAPSITNLAVRHFVVPYILDMEDIAVCWEKLKNVYATNSNAMCMQLQRELTNLKMEEATRLGRPARWNWRENPR